MDKRKFFGMAILIAGILTRASTPFIAAGSSPVGGELVLENTDAQIEEKIETALPLAVQMIDAASATLEKGWDGMSPDEQALFAKYFDPGKTGDIDAEFVHIVLGNYQKIRRGFGNELKMVYQEEGGECRGMRLYYTDFLKIHLCPFLHQEQNPERLARDLLHEETHMSLWVLDRAYYDETDSRYLALTPYGHWTAQLPIIGPILREIARADTLYHPDAYSRYAAAMTSK
jgi:hypothetical protein